jgi:hypothetical protein
VVLQPITAIRTEDGIDVRDGLSAFGGRFT